MSTLELTRRICYGLRLVMRRRSDEVIETASRLDFSSFKQIAQILDKESESNALRGGVVFEMNMWSDYQLLMLRSLLLELLTECTQMQVRRAIENRVSSIEDHVGISAVERLGNIINPKSRR